MVSFHLHSTLGGEGALFPFYRRRHQGSERFTHLLWPGACTPSPPRVHTHRGPGRMGDALPSSGPASWAHTLRPSRSGPGGLTPGRRGTLRQRSRRCLTYSPLLPGPSLWSNSVAAWGLRLWGPDAQVSQPNWPGTCPCPSPTSSSCMYQHLSSVGF